LYGSRPQSDHERFAGLDGLRAIAILLVIVWHAAISTGFPEAAMAGLRPLIMNGWAGVDLFFALSGFLITSLILREEGARARATGEQRFGLGRFYVRRALRILPVFYVVFLLNTFVLAQIPLFSSIKARQLEANGSFLGLFPYATFWGNYFPAYSPRLSAAAFYDPGEAYLVYWSLCVEEHFYLLWPLLLVLVKSWRLRLGISLAVCAGLAVLRAAASGGGWELAPANLHVVSHYRLDAILWGAAAALLVERWRPSDRARRVALLLAGSTLAAFLGTRALSIRPPATTLGMSLGMSAMAVTAALIVLEVASAPRSPVTRLLDWMPLRRIGQVSYGMYLVHFQAMDLGGLLLQSGPRRPTLTAFLAAALLFAALSFALAWVLHQLVERPFLRLKDRHFGARPH
jgi:peptidoglycan/LPS O-acetylase OafA/YrhL